MVGFEKVGITAAELALTYNVAYWNQRFTW
jgi:hypothetical protein